ncbi:hypothetical protein LINPERPRIM_LOCUS32173 [Linum perenne]
MKLLQLPILRDEAKLFFRLKKELNVLSSTVRTIEAVVIDAEQQGKPLSNQDETGSKKQVAILNGDYFKAIQLTGQRLQQLDQ